MSLKINVINCPGCGAALPVQEGNTQITCSYCGSKFAITNENEFVYRHVDEAQMKKAETERMQWLYEVEKEAKRKEVEKQYKEAQKRKRNIWISVIVILILVGLLKDNSTIGSWGLMIGIGYAIYYFRKKKNNPTHLDVELPNYPSDMLPPTPNQKSNSVNSKDTFCGNCGTKILNGSQFCPKCGKRIGGFSSQPVDKEPFLETLKKDPASLVRDFKQMNSNKKTIVLMVGLFLLLLIIVPSSNSSSHSSNTSSSTEVTNYRITQGSEYSYVYDSTHVYVATAASEELINVERWEYKDGTLQHDGSVGAYKINDPDNKFTWIDDEHFAFEIKIVDDDNYHIRYGEVVPFTIDINEQIAYRPTNFNPDYKAYTYTNDESHVYIALPLSEDLVKIECWNIKDGADQPVYEGDRWIVHTNSSDEDFEWTDSDHTSFTITLKDDKNYSWDKKKLVLFKLENPDASYDTCLDYLMAKKETGTENQE